MVTYSQWFPTFREFLNFRISNNSFRLIEILNNDLQVLKYRKIRNISPVLIAIFKHISGGLYSGGLIFGEGLYSEGSLC